MKSQKTQGLRALWTPIKLSSRVVNKVRIARSTRRTTRTSPAVIIAANDATRRTRRSSSTRRTLGHLPFVVSPRSPSLPHQCRRRLLLRPQSGIQRGERTGGTLTIAEKAADYNEVSGAVALKCIQTLVRRRREMVWTDRRIAREGRQRAPLGAGFAAFDKYPSPPAPSTSSGASSATAQSGG